ncbi:MAG: hypothetical protein AAF909_02945 [Pseudomonadota bacterium]
MTCDRADGTNSTSYYGLRRAACAAAAAWAVAASLILGSHTPAVAQSDEDRGSDVYLGVFKDDQKPIVVFIFSDPSSPEFSELDAIALYPRADYKAPAPDKFDPTEACLFTADFQTASIPERFNFIVSEMPIYGPNSSQGTIDPGSLPSFMAKEASGTLLAKNMLAERGDAAGYFNCTGYVWSQVLAVSPEQWDAIFKTLVEEQNGGQ